MRGLSALEPVQRRQLCRACMRLSALLCSAANASHTCDAGTRCSRISWWCCGLVACWTAAGVVLLGHGVHCNGHGACYNGCDVVGIVNMQTKSVCIGTHCSVVHSATYASAAPLSWPCYVRRPTCTAVCLLSPKLQQRRDEMNPQSLAGRMHVCIFNGNGYLPETARSSCRPCWHR